MQPIAAALSVQAPNVTGQKKRMTQQRMGNIRQIIFRRNDIMQSFNKSWRQL